MLQERGKEENYHDLSGDDVPRTFTYVKSCHLHFKVKKQKLREEGEVRLSPDMPCKVHDISILSGKFWVCHLLPIKVTYIFQTLVVKGG